jgi:hypothetical protein
MDLKLNRVRVCGIDLRAILYTVLRSIRFHKRRGIYSLLPSPWKQLDLTLSEPSLQEARSYTMSHGSAVTDAHVEMRFTARS